jgi:hypothetical protein
MGATAAASLGGTGVAMARTAPGGASRLGLAGSDAPWWLLAPTRSGSSIGVGWQVEDLAPVEAGATILTLSHRSGRIARVHICARHGRARGLAHTGLFDLVLMDGGQGDQPTEEGLGRALQQLARQMRRNELAVDDSALVQVVDLEPHSARVARYGPETLV